MQTRRSHCVAPDRPTRFLLAFGVRTIVARFLAVLGFGLSVGAIIVAVGFASQSGGVASQDALKRLIDGNARFVSGKSAAAGSQQLIRRRTELVNGQKPFAVVVSCSDSRVPPELVFDQGLGDLFVVRTAGEVVDNVALGSIEYAVEHLGVSLVVVLGHEKCGAVSATISGSSEHGHIADLVKAIAPVVEQSKSTAGDALENAVRAESVAVLRQLQGDAPVMSERVQSGSLSIVAAYYHLDSGKVEVLNL